MNDSTVVAVKQLFRLCSSKNTECEVMGEMSCVLDGDVADYDLKDLSVTSC
jgi:hypothetical protein